jgi:asparagine synthase (glutamine-hydrolysing)
MDLATDYDEETFIKGIYQLKKGHYLVCDGKSVETYGWYFDNDFSIDSSVFDNEDKIIDFTEELLCDAITKRLRADVPVCITLSGGLDSTTIYTLVRDRLKKDIAPFTFRHPGSVTDEYCKAAELTGAYNDKIISVQSDHSESRKKMEEALYYLEFPIWNLSAIAYMDMYKQIRNRGYVVALEGHGADEQLGGYPDTIRSAVFEYLLRLNLIEVFNIYRVLGDTNNPGIAQKSSLGRFLGSFVKNSMRKKRFDVNFQASINDIFEYRILPIVLRAFDRLAMRSSVESRLPFMDFRVVEFFRKIPLQYKVSKLGSKPILRRILGRYGKNAIYKDKKKMGFSYDIPAFFRIQENRSYMRNKIGGFDMPVYQKLKNKASLDISKADIGWRDTDAIWKVASLSIINEAYGLKDR